MEKLPILKFTPLLKSIVWGGRNMESVLGRALPSSDVYGESWEICDLEGEQSVVAAGELAGETIEEIIAKYNDLFLGTASLLEGRFPLLFKFIDAQKTLSVQVHPDANTCKKLGGGARPKTEAWYIIDCKPDAKLYVGLKKNVSKTTFETALKAGTVESYLHQKKVFPGNYVFLPSGTIHAIGDGIVLAEVQQSSNTTYRVFDWNRVGLDGAQRELHVNEALASIHFDEYEEPPMQAPASGRDGVRCDYFSMETVSFQPADEVSFSATTPIAVMMTHGAGRLTVSADGQNEVLKLGETVVVPACIAASVTLKSDKLCKCVVTIVL